MIRYILILVAFAALIIYVIRLGSRGQITGRFRTVSLILLGLLVLLVSAGLVYNAKYYSVDSVQEEFTQNEKRIVDRIESLYDQGEYTRARELAETYREVQDPALEALYRRSRRAELEQRAEELKGESPRALLEVWRELAALTGRQEYRDKAREQRERLQNQAKRALRSRIEELPDWSVSAKALGFRLLRRIDPQQIAYRQRFDALKQAAEQRIQDSPWNDICSASSVDPCAHFGAFVLRPGGANGGSERLGEVLGVSRRSKGTLIDRNGTTAPEDGYYFLVHESGRVTLADIRFVEVQDPYASIAVPSRGRAGD